LAIAILKIVNFARIEITHVTKSTCHKPKGSMLTCDLINSKDLPLNNEKAKLNPDKS
jgi:hypothetical protein